MRRSSTSTWCSTAITFLIHLLRGLTRVTNTIFTQTHSQSYNSNVTEILNSRFALEHRYVQIFLSTSEGQFYAQDIKFDSNGRVVQSRITHAFPSVRQGSSVITSLCITHYVTNTDTLKKRRRRQSERGTTNEGSANGM